ncbi:cytosolic thiouridylase subunit 2 isoform X1 [Megalopta genalis]|uniref:cytosolic thiouridylase subunit 2 isoform X1 n=2 Tax=Megalopta genalis TaxID=115081 RepID=UPI003FD0E25F
MCTLNSIECDTFETNRTVQNATDTAPTCVTNIKLFCAKCGSKEIEISLRSKCGYCKACFLSVLMHKFKATLGKSKSMHPTDSVLIAHSGKANSTALVQLIKDNANDLASKRLRFTCKILYIDDGMIKGFSLEERKRVRNALVKEADNLKMAMYVTSLTTSTSDVHCEEIRTIDSPEAYTTRNDEFMEEVFRGMESETAKDELLMQLRRKLLVSAACKLNCNKVFVADTSIDLAVKVLGDISTGRGSQVPQNVSFSDTRSSGVALLRPLRDFTQDDIEGYLECHNLTPIFASRIYNRSYPVSIRTVARNFVRQLDSNLNGTVSTIYRTSEKLATKMEKLHNINSCGNTDVVNNIRVFNDTCILCELALNCPNSQEQLSVVQARIFSQLVSTNVNPLTSTASSLQTNGQVQEINGSVKRHNRCDSDTYYSFNRESIRPDLIEAHLCYGCKLFALNSKQMYNLLLCLLHEKIQEKSQITRLQEDIAEFLL